MTAVPTDAGQIHVGDAIRLEPDGPLWTVTLVHRVGGTVSLTLTDGTGEIQIVRDAREKLTVVR